MEIYLITRSDGKLMGVEIDGKIIQRKEGNDGITWCDLAEELLTALYESKKVSRRRWEENDPSSDGT